MFNKQSDTSGNVIRKLLNFHLNNDDQSIKHFNSGQTASSECLMIRVNSRFLLARFFKNLI